MGSTCSSARANPYDGVIVEKANSVTTISGEDPEETVDSDSSPGEVTTSSRSIPDELLSHLRQRCVPDKLSDDVTTFVRSIVAHYTSSLASDSEALAVLSVLNRVILDRDTCVMAATNLNDRGFPNEAMACLRYLSPSEWQALEVQQVIRQIQYVRFERWNRADAEIVEYMKFWNSLNEQDATELCEEHFDGTLTQMHAIFPDLDSKFGIRGMLDDTPSHESLKLQWPYEGNMNAAEQQKSVALWMVHMENYKRYRKREFQRIENIYAHRQAPPQSSLNLARLLSKPPCKLYGVRFVRVKAILAMKELVKFEDLPAEAFTDAGHFAVSYGSSGSQGPATDILQRLQKVLQQVDGIGMEDGVFIDWCCAPSGDSLTMLFAKSIFEQCHAIFLPSPDFFTRPWCTFECMAWFLSPFPNQALGDYNLFRCIYLTCVFHFGRPPFVLDRPELQALGRILMGTTDSSKDKEFLTWNLGENRIKSTGLRESLTKVIFKAMSTIVI